MYPRSVSVSSSNFCHVSDFKSPLTTTTVYPDPNNTFVVPKFDPIPYEPLPYYPNPTIYPNPATITITNLDFSAAITKERLQLLTSAYDALSKLPKQNAKELARIKKEILELLNVK